MNSIVTAMNGSRSLVLFMCASLLTLTGCVTDPRSSNPTDPLFTPQPGTGSIFVLARGVAIIPDVMPYQIVLDDKSVGILGPMRFKLREYLKLSVPPGEHKLSMTFQGFQENTWTTTRMVNVEAGKNYFVLIRINAGVKGIVVEGEVFDTMRSQQLSERLGESFVSRAQRRESTPSE
jgi:hypothetical protein